ncbi:hypothetical protein DQ04_04941010 [Trypanosoma grayi]|uniref:hypothetical protein n=1 Tax=Trypanosoma grayi TaxID=71804 RepID=UPI0004F400F1|nr:hypothetical protein DQ04_04941010 [Trypanosoma grayi]KEG09616.1 hypothetical protein DQ04_04941010 [Trypanosoma grayi]
MVLLYHRWYETDLTAVAATGSGCRDVQMSWCYADPRRGETTVVVLVAAPVARADTANDESPRHALKITLFTAAAAAAATEPAVDGIVHDNRVLSPQEEVRSALFELHGPLEASVVKGVSGVVFVSTRQFFFHAAAGGTALDCFTFTGEGGWERQRDAVHPLDVAEPLRRVLSEAGGDTRPKLHLVTRLGTSLQDTARDVVDVLVVASKEDGSPASPHAKSQGGRRVPPSLAAPPSNEVPLTSSHTFVMALLRFTTRAPYIGMTTTTKTNTTAAAAGAWDLLHLFVERAVPFRQYVDNVNSRNAALGAGGTEAAVTDPSHCTWCYLPHSDLTGGDCAELRRGMVVAIVPRPSSALAVVCGGFDAESNSYRVGIVANQATGRSGAVQETTAAVVGDDIDDVNPEETLWSLTEDTHTVQMMLLGAPLESLRGSEEAAAPGTTQRRQLHRTIGGGGGGGGGGGNCSSTWMRQAGLTMVLRFVVDFLDDGMGSISRNNKDVILDCDDSTRRQQGLYAAVSAPWERSRHARFPLPRAVCWLGAVPLPIGAAVTSTMLFPDDNDGSNNDHIDKGNSMGAARVGMDDEDATSWYHALPTSLASSSPLCVGNSALRCFVSINALLKKTRLTYVLEMRPQVGGSGARHVKASELMYIRPTCCEHVDSDNDDDDDTYYEAVAVCLARAAAGALAMRDRGVVKADTSAAAAATEVTLHNGLLDWVSPEAIMYEAWRKVAKGAHAPTAMVVLDAVTQSVEVADTPEVRALANTLRRFLLAFLQELDWTTYGGNDLLRGVVLLMLGAVDVQNASSHYREASIRDGGLIAPHLSPSGLRSMQLLLKRTALWHPLAATLFAWVNCKTFDKGGEDEEGKNEREFLLEDVLQVWEAMAVGDGRTESNNNNNNNNKKEGSIAFNDILRRLRGSQETSKYQSAVAALARGNLTTREVAALAWWKDTQVGDPVILLLQLLLQVSLACDDNGTAGSSASAAGVYRLAVSVVEERFPHGELPHALVPLLLGLNFSILEDLPLTAMCGGLPVVFLLHHLTTLCGDGEVERESQDVIESGVQLLRWLCGDRAERAEEVLSVLRAARVPLVELCLGRRQVYHAAACTSIVSSGSCCSSRALHHLVASPTVSLLTEALTADESNNIPVGDVASGKFALILWTLVLENDEAAAFNPNLLRQLYASLHPRSDATPRADSRVALLLDFLRPVFLTTIPRILAALGNKHETVGGALSMSTPAAALPGALALGPPLDESEGVDSVLRTTLLEVRQLLLLHAGDSLEVQCLLLLFNVFRASCTAALERPSGSRSSNGGGDGADRADEGQVIFAFSPAEMYFVALQILSNEPARFLVAAEIIRRGIRSYLVHQLNIVLPERGLASVGAADQHDEASKKWRGSKAFLNDTVENLGPVISAFEKTAPLYAHTLLLLFLDESAALAGTVGARTTTTTTAAAAGVIREDQSHLSEVHSGILQCAQQAAHAQWTRLHQKEKKLLSRVLSDRLALPIHNAATDETYVESDVHHEAVRVAARLQQSLQQRLIDATLLNAVRDSYFPGSSAAAAGIPCGEGVAAAGRMSAVPSTNSALLVKEEAYVRRHLQRQLLQEYKQLIDSDAFRAALGVLYLALREEQRRRVFVTFVGQQNDIMLAFVHTLCDVMREDCRSGAHVLWRSAMEEMQRRFRYFMLQERESRSAVEAVCFGERSTLFEFMREQCALFVTEFRVRLRYTEEEEMQRDALYETFAKEEMGVLQRYEARLEEEAWREEDAAWAAELEQQQQQTSSGNAFLQWQGRHLAANENVAPVFRQPPPPPPPEAEPVMPAVSSSPASALAPLLQMGRVPMTESDSGGGFHTLLETSDSIFSAFSRLQKQIISTVAPPPSQDGKGNSQAATTEAVPARLVKEQQNDARAVPCPAVSVPATHSPHSTSAPASTAMGGNEGWGENLEEVTAASVPQLRRTECEASKSNNALDKLPAAPDDGSKQIRLRASAATAGGKRRAPRQRRLGEVVSLDAVLEDQKGTAPILSPLPQEEEKQGEPQKQIGSTLVTGRLILHAPETEEICSASNRPEAIATTAVIRRAAQIPPARDGDNAPTSLVHGGLAVRQQMVSDEHAEDATPHDITPEIKPEDDVLAVVVIKEETKNTVEYEKVEELRMCSGKVSVLLHDEDAARCVTCDEEQLTRAFLLRRFVLGV